MILRPDLSVSSRISLISRTEPDLYFSMILSMIASAVVVGGISVIFQVVSAAKDLKPLLCTVVLSRLLHGTLSAGLIFLFEVISPRTLSTGAFQITKTAALHTNPIASASLLLLCVVLICFTKTALGKAVKHQTSL